MATTKRIAQALVNDLAFEDVSDIRSSYGGPCNAEAEVEGLCYAVDFTLQDIHRVVECDLFAYYFDRPCDTWRPMKMEEKMKDDIIDAFLDELVAKYRELDRLEEERREQREREELEHMYEMETRRALAY